MEKRVSLRMLFYIKRTKLLKNGEAPIYLKITFRGTSSEMAINRSVKHKLWNKDQGVVKGKLKEAVQLNLYMETLKFQLREHMGFLREEGKMITAKAIRNSFLGIEEEQKSIIGIFEEHNENLQKLVKIDFSAATLQKYNSCLNYLKEYIKMRYKQDDILLDQVDHEFISYFESFLKVEKRNGHNTATKYMTNLKKVIRLAIANAWIKHNPFANYKMKLKKVDRGFLNDDELDKIMKLDFPTDRLGQVRDCFLVSCFTGLAFSDLKSLTPDNIVTGTDGNKWVKINRRKTNVKSTIPVLPLVQQIIDKYSTHLNCLRKGVLLPVTSNQKMNAYLHEIGRLCDIKKNMTTHLARHTFATTVTLNNDVPIESVSKMLGHSSINMTKIYARLLDKKVGNDMKKLHDRYK